MSPADVRAALSALCAEVGPKASAWVQISNSLTCSATLYPDDIIGKVTLRSGNLNDWSEAEPALRALWEEHRDLHASNTIKGMALAIIRLTAELDECTDAALRCEFTQQEIERYGDQASDLATEMGGRGPFRIVKLAGANDIGEAA